MKLTFEWHEAKSKENLRKLNISFDQAKSVFGDPFSAAGRLSDPAAVYLQTGSGKDCSEK